MVPDAPGELSLGGRKVFHHDGGQTSKRLPQLLPWRWSDFKPLEPSSSRECSEWGPQVLPHPGCSEMRWDREPSHPPTTQAAMPCSALPGPNLCPHTGQHWGSTVVTVGPMSPWTETPAMTAKLSVAHAS